MRLVIVRKWVSENGWIVVMLLGCASIVVLTGYILRWIATN
jgi:hypothetical protein